MKYGICLATTIMLVLFVFDSAKANDNTETVRVNLRPLKEQVSSGELISFRVEVVNDSGADLYLLNSYWFEKPVMWIEGSVSLKLGYLFRLNSTGYEFRLPPYTKISKNLDSRTGDVSYKFFSMLDPPYWVNLSEIKGSTIANLAGKESALRSLTQKYKYKEQGWFVDVMLKPDIYNFNACISYVDRETIRHFEDVLELEEERVLHSKNEECVLWDKRLKYLMGRMKTVCSDNISVNIKP